MDQQDELIWSEIWARMHEAEQQLASEAFVGFMRSCPKEITQGFCEPFLKKLAKHIRFRPQTVVRMPPVQLAAEIRRHLQELFTDRAWRHLFQAYYMANKNKLMCRFLDLCGIPHDDQGMVTADDIAAPNNIEEIAGTLTKEFSAREVGLYFAVLLQHSPDAWAFTRAASPRALLEQDKEVAQVPVASETDEELSTPDISEDFTQLDRVLIEKVIATIAGEEGALSPGQLVDLIETVHGLDTHRKRTYFHLGFLDSLLPGRESEFNRPEMNDERRQWYLAGLLAGVARRRDAVALKARIKERNDDFRRAAGEPGRAGAVMANTIYPLLLEEGLLNEALVLLKGQLPRCGIDMARKTLAKASELLRKGDVASASGLLTTLRDQLAKVQFEPGQQAGLRSAIERRFGQVLQAQGDLTGAARIFKELLSGDPGAHTPELLADLGLVESGFRTLAEVRLSDGAEQREVMRSALGKGCRYFEQAVEKAGIGAPNGHYALAVLHYLDYADSESGERGQRARLHDRAMLHVGNSITGMMSSDSVEAYETLGLLDRCRFMQAVLLMAKADLAVAPAAMTAWREITQNAGLLPAKDIQQLLDDSELIDRQYALEIAESVWRHRKKDALEIIRNPAWIIQSDYLRNELLAHARNESLPRAERWNLWALLVPALIQAGERQLAEDGLDVLEGLADDTLLAERMVGWLEKRDHYDPIWNDENVIRARFQLLRRLGRDADAFAQLRFLYYALRDQKPEEACQVLDLFDELGANKALFADLPRPYDGKRDVSVADGDEVERSLKDGAPVKVLFVGGNEIQEQYDEEVLRTVVREWPGVEIQFEHTGWSSNWGREVDRLRRAASQANAVVLMTMIRTMLGRTLREALNNPPRPWVPCTGKGRDAVIRSIRKAAVIGLQQSQSTRIR